MSICPRDACEIKPDSKGYTDQYWSAVWWLGTSALDDLATENVIGQKCLFIFICSSEMVDIILNFLTIACVLGTGILGLPAALYNSGFYPFLVVFIITFVMQALIILIGVEILQKAYAIQIKYDKENQETPKDIEKPPQNSTDTTSEMQNDRRSERKLLNSETELLPLNEMMNEDTCDELEDQPAKNGSVFADHDIPSDIRPPDLHLLGEMFLSNCIRHVFDIVVIFEMETMLITYSLAGSEAYSEMLGIKCIYVIPVFNWSIALFIVFGFNLIKPVVSILSFIKASLFTMAVIVTFFVISNLQENLQNNFTYIQDSFLLSTVALGGTFLIMPLLYKNIENDVSQIKKYRLAVVMGLVTCAILNILWCWAVLEIVPQHCTPMTGTNQSHCNSLESANENGEVSTKPLINMIHYKHQSLFWVATVIEVFIIISITVSFMTIGLAMHHYVCGFVESNLPTWFSSKYAKQSPKIVDIGKKCASSFLSLILFGIIFLVDMLNPKGFLDVMGTFLSSALNAVNIFAFLMFLMTKNKENNKLKIPLPLSNMVMPFIFLVPLFFGFAIGYDIYLSIVSSLHH